MKEITTVIWDWNGTLLNDINICIESMNTLLSERNISTLSKHTYKNIFTFPVQEYYVRAGFDFTHESFDQVSIEFIDLYKKKLKDAAIFTDARLTLSQFRNSNIRQLMVSAMEHNSLVNSVIEKGIQEYFEFISGISDHHAVSKLGNARAMVKKLDLDIKKTCLIGDTLHDLEVADALGVRCILVANGHQSYERLNNNGSIVVQNLAEVLRQFNLANNNNQIKNNR